MVSRPALPCPGYPRAIPNVRTSPWLGGEWASWSGHHRRRVSGTGSPRLSLKTAPQKVVLRRRGQRQHLPSLVMGPAGLDHRVLPEHETGKLTSPRTADSRLLFPLAVLPHTPSRVPWKASRQASAQTALPLPQLRLGFGHRMSNRKQNSHAHPTATQRRSEVSLQRGRPPRKAGEWRWQRGRGWVGGPVRGEAQFQTCLYSLRLFLHL